MGRQHRGSISAAALVLGAAVIAAAAPAAAAPLGAKRVFKVESGYLDSHFAISPDGKHVAYVHVASKGTFLIIRRLTGDMGQAAKVSVSNFLRVQLGRTVPARYAAVPPARVFFGPGSQRVIVIKRVTASRKLPLKEAAIFDLTGKPAGKIPQFHNLALRQAPPAKGPAGAKGGAAGPRWELVTYVRTKYPNPQLLQFSHDVSVFAYPKLTRKQFGRLQWTDAAGKINNRNPAWTIQYWAPDLTRVMCKVPGRYDRKRDLRLPARSKMYDILARKFVTDDEISDLRQFVATRDLRSKRPTERYLLQLSGDQKGPQFKVVGPDNQEKAVPEPNPPLKRFDFDTFSQQESVDGASILFALTIDPQWPTLFGRSINVPEVFHLFRYDIKANRATLLGTVKSKKQWLAWSYGGGKLAVMRLHRYWKLGHRELEIIEIPR